MKAAVIEPVGGHGGMDYYDFGLCQGLSLAGIEVALFTCDETEPPNDAAYKVRRPYRKIFGSDSAWLRGLRFLWGSLVATSEARSEGFRLAHLHFFHVGPLELFNVLLAKLFGMRVVITSHDVQSFVRRLSAPWMLYVSYRLGDRIIAHSRVGRDELIRVLGLPEKKISVIPHGNYLHSLGQPSPKVGARERLGLSENGVVLLFFGQIKKVKGLDVLIEAMPSVLRKFPEAVLLIAGKEWKDNLDRYWRRIEELGIEDSCVVHPGYVPNQMVPDYYGAADLVVLPYRHIYQSGVLLMAMGYGKPVVASDIPGMTEVITDGETGYLFAAGDHNALTERMIQVLSYPQESEAVAGKGRDHVRGHYDWSKIGEMTAGCYRAVLRK